VIGRIDPVELFGLREGREHRLEFGARGVLVVRALHEDLGRGAGLETLNAAPAGRVTGGEQELRAWGFAGHPRGNARAEAEAGERVSEIGVLRAQPGERGLRVFDAFADFTRLTEIEAQDDGAGMTKTARDPVDNFVVHRAAVERVRVTDERGQPGRAGIGLFEEALGQAGDHGRLDEAWHG